MEPTNHPFGKENDLRKTSMIMFHDNLQGCTLCWLPLFFCSPPKPLPASFQFVHQPLRAGWTDEAFSRGGFFSLLGWFGWIFILGWGNLLRNLQCCVLVHGIFHILLIHLYKILLIGCEVHCLLCV